MITKAVIFGLVIILMALLFAQTKKNLEPIEENTNEEIANTLEQTLSDDTIQFSYPTNFGLAVKKDQVPTSSYIPPCSEGFDYCFYYDQEEFEKTNFESAGIRIQKPLDLKTESLCINTPPDGFDSSKSPNGVNTTENYSASIFSNIGDAGAGHFASGELYRIFTNNKCYEVETRIGETQFANYEPGTVEKFDEAHRDKVYSYFNSLLNNLTLLTTKEKIKLPVSED